MQNMKAGGKRDGSTLVGQLWEGLKKTLQASWRDRAGWGHCQALAAGTQWLLQKQKTLGGLRQGTEEWVLDPTMPGSQREAVLQVLESLGEGRRRATLFQMKGMGAPGGEHPDPDDKEQCEGHNGAEGDGTTREVERVLGRVRLKHEDRVRKKRRRGVQDTGMDEVVGKVTGYDAETDRYEMQCLTGRVEGYENMGLKELGALLAQQPVFVPLDWEDSEDHLGEPDHGAGWWMKITQRSQSDSVWEEGKTYWGRILRKPGYGWEEEFELDPERLLSLMERLGKEAKTISVRMGEDWFGDGIRLPPLLVNYWMRQRRNGVFPPVEIECRLPTDLYSRRVKSRGQNRAQRYLSDYGHYLEGNEEEGKTRKTWVRQHLPCRTALAGFNCTVDLNEKDTEFVDTRWGTICMEKSRVGLRREGTWEWTMERAKFHQWRARTMYNDETLARKGIIAARRIREREDKGYQMLAWSTLLHVAQQTGATVCVGPEVAEAPPLMKWSGGSDGYQWAAEETPLILMEAVENGEREGVLHRAATRDRAIVVAREKELGEGSRVILEGDDWLRTTLPESAQRAYTKGWWQNGNKKIVAMGGEMMVWYRATMGRVVIPQQDPRNVPPTPLWRELPAGFRDEWAYTEYLLNTMAGRHQLRPGVQAWTDGSVQKIDQEKRMGAGYYAHGLESRTGFFRVGGDCSSLRAELAALTGVLRAAGQQPATVYTDSYNVARLLYRWGRGDFAPFLEDENNRDILGELGKVMERRRKWETHVVWVAAHKGEPGNEAADRQADKGCRSDQVEWDTPKEAMIMWDWDTGEMVGENGWGRGVAKRAREYDGTWTAAMLKVISTARATESLLREGNGKELVGEILTAAGMGEIPGELPERAIRDFHQARAFCYPTRDVVARNGKGREEGGKCPLCGQQDSFMHLYTECEELAGAQSEMHNEIVQALVGAIKEARPDLQIFQERSAGSIWPDIATYDEAMAGFVPDAVGIDERGKTVVVIEFARSMTDETDGMEARAWAKRNHYHGLEVYLRRRHKQPEWTVRTDTYIMNVLARVHMDWWRGQLEKLGLTQVKARGAIKTSMRACIMAAHRLHNVRRSREEGLRCRHRVSPGGPEGTAEGPPRSGIG